MIRYDLICNKEHVFEGWFPNMAAFDDQSAKGELACPVCGSAKVSKGIMAPNIGHKSNSKENSAVMAARGQLEMRKFLQQVRRHVEQNSEHVGEKFTEEARKIHYGETDERNIHGDATPAQVTALREEGIEIAALPWADLEN